MTPLFSHFLKQEPHIRLWNGGPEFSLFYDYDELRDGKLSPLSADQKAKWLAARTEMTFLEPLRLALTPDTSTFESLLDTSSEKPRSFSIALMSVMLNGTEALGSFMHPDLCKPESERDDNKGCFEAFVENYMADWWRKPVGGGSPDVTAMLWKHFRVGIAHGFCITRSGSLEFLENDRFRWGNDVLQVCPIHFLRDLDAGTERYFVDLTKNPDLLSRFHRRFNHVYPPRQR
jgi:hypothetical protein